MERIFIQGKVSGSAIKSIQQLANRAKIPVNYVPKEKLNKLTNLRHQGVIAILSDVTYYNVEDIVQFCFDEGRDPFIVLLDGVTDVRNFGAICRTALGMQADAVVIGFNNAASINEFAIKASAGAIHHIKICREKDLSDVVEYLNNTGISTVALSGKADSMVGDLDLTGPIAVILGDEGKGVSAALLESALNTCKIPMHKTLESYNVSVAAAMMMYEVNRQRSV